MSDTCRPQLSPVSLLALGLVVERPMHPYEIFQTIVERQEDRLAKIRPGTLYHAVDRLASQGLIEVHEVQREGNRPERTVYAITADGRRVLADSLEQTIASHPVEYPEIYLALSEAHGLPRTLVVELLEKRVAAMRGELDIVVSARDGAAGRGVPEMFYLDVGCRLATLRAQIDWIDDLIERLRSNRIEWLDDPESPYATEQVKRLQELYHPANRDAVATQQSSTTQKVSNS